MADQIRAQCASGTLPAGTRLPSVRELARELAVNQNTVLKVYDRLISEGLIESRRGEGTFVRNSRSALSADRCHEQLQETAHNLIQQAILLGVDQDQLQTIIDRAWKTRSRQMQRV
jgi:GntR family transcriptional regulator